MPVQVCATCIIALAINTATVVALYGAGTASERGPGAGKRLSAGQLFLWLYLPFTIHNFLVMMIGNRSAEVCRMLLRSKRHSRAAREGPSSAVGS